MGGGSGSPQLELWGSVSSGRCDCVIFPKDQARAGGLSQTQQSTRARSHGARVTSAQNGRTDSTCGPVRASTRGSREPRPRIQQVRRSRGLSFWPASAPPLEHSPREAGLCRARGRCGQGAVSALAESHLGLVSAPRRGHREAALGHLTQCPLKRLVTRTQHSRTLGPHFSRRKGQFCDVRGR